MRSPAEVTPGYVYVPDLKAAGALIDLSPEETHYVARVCRARAGDCVTAADGRGRIATLRLVQRGPRVAAHVESVASCAPRTPAWVLSGPPEGQRADWLVEKLGELGIERWQPIDCERAGWDRHAARQERWHRIAVAAMKQSRSAFLLEIAEPVPLRAALRALPAGASRWLARQDGPPPSRLQGEPAVVVVGPSSGLSEAETDALSAEGFKPIRLAECRLRTETAAMAWAAWWASISGTPSA